MSSNDSPPAPQIPDARPSLDFRESPTPLDPPVPPDRPLAAWIFVVVLLAVLTAMRTIGEAWSPISLLLFLPRWLWLAPWGALVIVAIVRRRFRKQVPVLLVLFAIIAIFLMNLSLPLSHLRSSWPGGRTQNAEVGLRMMTFNRWNRDLDPQPLIDLIERERIDLICFQEGKPDAKLDRYFRDHGWSADPRGHVVSRFPIAEVLPPPKLPDSYPDLWPTEITRVRLRHPSGVEFVAASIHVPSMRHAVYRLLDGDFAGFRRQIDWRREQIQLTSSVLRNSGNSPLLAAGDFNTPADSPTLEPARRGFRFAFEEAGWGYGWTWPSWSPYLRLEHIIGSPEWRFVHAWVGPDLGSDHRPLIADVVLREESLAKTRSRQGQTSEEKK